MNKLPSEAGKMKTFRLEGYCRYHSGNPSLPHLDGEIGFAFRQLCGPSGTDLHGLTCYLKQDGLSMTGDPSLAEKVIKYRVTVVVQAELIDDVEVQPEQVPVDNRVT